MNIDPFWVPQSYMNEHHEPLKQFIENEDYIMNYYKHH